MDTRKNCGVAGGAATVGTFALGLLGTTFLCGTAAPALAAAEDDMLDVSGLERVTDGSLDDLRGGFKVAGYEISFGITITTTVNGQQLLQTSFNVNQPGQIDNLVTSYIQQQQAALAGGSGNGDAGNGNSGNNIGDIEVEVEIDEDGEIDIDIDSDVDFDEDSAPEIAQAIENFEAAMEALEDNGAQTTTQGGQFASGETQYALSQTVADDAATSGGNISTPSADATSADLNVAVPSAPEFQQASQTPLPAAQTALANDVPGEDAQIDMSAVETAAPSSTPNTSTTTWVVSELANGIQVSSSDLATTILQQIGNDISTSIVNRADNMSIEHTTEMNIFLENFSDMQTQALATEATSNAMQQMMDQAINQF